MIDPVSPSIDPMEIPRSAPVSLRKAIKAKSDQDVIRCLGCGACNIHQRQDDMDVSVDSLIQMVLEGDEDALSTRTLWSDSVLESIRYSCKRGLNLRGIFLALRNEAQERAQTRSMSG